MFNKYCKLHATQAQFSSTVPCNSSLDFHAVSVRVPHSLCSSLSLAANNILIPTAFQNILPCPRKKRSIILILGILETLQRYTTGKAFLNLFLNCL